MPGKVKSKYVCSSWEEVNAFLLQIGKNTIETQKLEAEMNSKLNEIKLEYDVKAKGLKADTAQLETAIENFAENTKDEFLKTRHKELTFGVVAYRIAESVTIRSIKACVNSIKQLGMMEYLRIEEKPNKDKLKELDQSTLAKIGASYKKEDKIRIEANLEKIKTD